MIEFSLLNFMYGLAFGTGFFQFLANSKDTGVGFVKLINAIIFSLILFCLYFIWKNNNIFVFQLTLLDFFVSLFIYLKHKDKKSVLMWGLYLFQIISLGMGLSVLNRNSNSLFVLSSAFFLGIINYAMILGHYYLVVPKLSERPLVIAMKITWGILIVKCIFSSINFYQNYNFFEESTVLGFGYLFNWILLVMRYLWGYLAVGILSYYGFRLSKIRSTQSATGVMYVMVFFSFVGELISLYLNYSYGLKI